jgi:hypothetical protein
MSFFSVFDSKEGEFEGPKASPTRNKYQNHKLKNFQSYKWYRMEANFILGSSPRK